ncbi:MAG: hypothetical protein IJ228_05230 [Succinivibrio sp.]|nr:hypothetical protein [Succinivibrio sp.]
MPVTADELLELFKESVFYKKLREADPRCSVVLRDCSCDEVRNEPILMQLPPWTYPSQVANP